MLMILVERTIFRHSTSIWQFLVYKPTISDVGMKNTGLNCKRADMNSECEIIWFLLVGWKLDGLREYVGYWLQALQPVFHHILQLDIELQLVLINCNMFTTFWASFSYFSTILLSTPQRLQIISHLVDNLSESTRPMTTILISSLIFPMIWLLIDQLWTDYNRLRKNSSVRQTCLPLY
jgi:hypothetical protein